MGLIIAHGIAIARHQLLQTTVTEGCSQATISAHAVDGPGDEAFLP